MLPGWNDCARRAAAKQFGELVDAAGFELRKLLPSIGAAVGTATHAAVAHMLRGGTLDEGVAEGAAKLVEEIAPGAEWDDTTPNLHAATDQVRRLSQAYLPVLETVRPVGVEMELKATIDGRWEMTGHLDVLTDAQRVDDLKTGAVRRPYQAQLGGYALLAEANGYAVKEVGITFIKRSRTSKPQPPPERQDYDLADSKSAAYSAIASIRRAVERFEQAGDPFAFAANPMSLMCSARYCPAWGTKFCTMHMPPKAVAESVVD